MSKQKFDFDERYLEIGLLGGLAFGFSSFYAYGHFLMALSHAIIVAILLTNVTRFISANLTFIIILGGLLYLSYG